MPAQWTGELVGRMHNAGVTAKQLAAAMRNPRNGQFTTPEKERCRQQEQLSRAKAAVFMAVQKLGTLHSTSEQAQHSMIDVCYYLGRATAMLEDLDEAIAHG